VPLTFYLWFARNIQCKLSIVLCDNVFLLIKVYKRAVYNFWYVFIRTYNSSLHVCLKLQYGITRHFRSPSWLWQINMSGSWAWCGLPVLRLNTRVRPCVQDRDCMRSASTPQRLSSFTWHGVPHLATTWRPRFQFQPHGSWTRYRVTSPLRHLSHRFDGN